MAHVVTQPCIGSKDHSCVDFCPVDCILPLDPTELDRVEQVYIDPTQCIDCGACVEQCPVGAIYAEADVPPEYQHFIAINAEYFAKS